MKINLSNSELCNANYGWRYTIPVKGVVIVMQKTLSPYLAMLKMRFISQLQYRAAAWAGIATQFFFGFMYVMIYSAFYRSSAAQQPMEISQLVSYFWLQQAFLAMIAPWISDNSLRDLIEKGHIAYELCRPCDLYTMWYIRQCANRLSAASLRCLPILLIATILPNEYRMSLPADLPALAMFIVTLLLGMLVSVAIVMLMYVLTIKTLKERGPRNIVLAFGSFLQGTIIPIPLMPESWQRVMNFLPFRYVSDLPFRVYSGNITVSDALLLAAISLIWCVAIIIIGRWAFNRALRSVVVQGG